MQRGNEQTSQGFAWFGGGDDNGEQTASGIGRSIRPGTAVPSTVLLSDMGDGSVLLEAWREGPSAYLSPSDALPLKRELVRAFGGIELARRGSQGDAR